MDGTYFKVKGRWTYLYRAVGRDAQPPDLWLFLRRNMASARRFFKRAIATKGRPDRVVIDKSGANLAGLQAGNVMLKCIGEGRRIPILQVKYRNTSLEQDHCFMKWFTRPMMNFNPFHAAAATLAGIETAHMIRKGQIPTNGSSSFQAFARWRKNHVQQQDGMLSSLSGAT